MTATSRRRSISAFAEGVRSGDRAILSQAITLIESSRPADEEKARAILERCMSATGTALRIGITGVPGVGKSTFIDALGARLVRDGHRLAVLAVDPSSERSGGSILGDKTRMEALAAEPGAYIRPSPTGGSLGGVARRTRESILLCEAAGFDLVFVETVGVGQAETTVHSMTDIFLLLALAGAGDELQGVKRGVVEMADIVAVTKADGANREAAARAQDDYRQALRLFPSAHWGWATPALTCSAATGEGLDQVWEKIQAYETLARRCGFFDDKRRQQARHWMMQTIEHRLHTHFYQHKDVKERMPALEQQVISGKMTAASAAEELLALYYD